MDDSPCLRHADCACASLKADIGTSVGCLPNIEQAGHGSGHIQDVLEKEVAGLTVVQTCPHCYVSNAVGRLLGLVAKCDVDVFIQVPYLDELGLVRGDVPC